MRQVLKELLDLGGKGGGFGVETFVGDADGAVAGDEEARIAGSVALEGGAVAVEFPAVQLDDESGGGPEDIYLVAEDVDIRAGGRESVGAAEALEAILQRRAGRGGCTRFGEQAANRLQGAPPITALAHPLNSVQLEQIEPIRLLPGVLELPEVDDFGEVEERAGDRRDRDAVPPGVVLCVETTAV